MASIMTPAGIDNLRPICANTASGVSQAHAVYLEVRMLDRNGTKSSSLGVSFAAASMTASPVVFSAARWRRTVLYATIQVYSAFTSPIPRPSPFTACRGHELSLCETYT